MILTLIVTFYHTGFGIPDDLTMVKAPVSGDDKCNHTDKCKPVQIGAAKHFNTQDNRRNGRIGGTAEQSNQRQRRRNPRLKAQNPAQNSAKCSADTKRRNNFAAFEARR